MTNSVDQDQLASSEANYSGSTLFAKTGHVLFSKFKRRVKMLMQDSCDRHFKGSKIICMYSHMLHLNVNRCTLEHELIKYKNHSFINNIDPHLDSKSTKIHILKIIIIKKKKKIKMSPHTW